MIDYSTRIEHTGAGVSLCQLADLNKSSSVAVAAEVLTALAELVRAFADVIRAVFGRGDSDPS